MTRYTQYIIRTDPQVHAAALGPLPNGKYGIYIGTYDESPSGCKRPMVLLTSDGHFDTAEEARKQGEFFIKQIQEGNEID